MPKIDAILIKVSTTVDNSLRLTFDCQESPPKTEAEFLAMRQKFGILQFNEKEN
jgi:hypothetical protein